MKYKKSIKLLVFWLVLCFVIAFNNIAFAGTLSSDINGIDENKYPGVKSLIQKLQRQHSNYNFQIYYTGIDWTEAVIMEYQGHGKSPKNVFSAKDNYKGKWYCPICGNKKYDTGWYCASIDAIKYMMDPRNSIDEDSVFQFKSLETADVSSENIQSVINSKYASYSYINNPTAINAIVEASSTYNFNGYSILAKIINEQGVGNSPLIKGEGYNGQYPGVYNFFNVGAYGNSKDEVILKGLKYAQSKGWNSVRISILGGSEYYKTHFIGKGQNTLYYQRFNVVYEYALFSNQYQQNIMAAESSGRSLKSYYTISNTLNTINHTFIIPLYENMPATACGRPSTTENSKLEYTEEKVIINKLPVKASPNSNRVISYLNCDEKVKVLERATKVSADGKYWDIIVSNTDGTYGYVIRDGITQKISLPQYIFDSKYYADNNTDLKSAYGYDEDKLIQHFVTYGVKEGRVSSPTFDVRYYVENNSDVKTAFKNDYEAAFKQFRDYGCKEYRKSSKQYDGTFYKCYYKDLNNLTSVKLMEQYINYGIKEGRMAALDDTIEKIVFDASVYSDCNSDIKAVYGNNVQALRMHWLQYGIEEGRMASLVFDPRIYLELNNDIQNAFGTNYKAVFEQYIKYGIKEPRSTSLIFDVSAYLKNNNDVKTVFGSDYKTIVFHFVNYGIKEGRKASVVFDVRTYLSANNDIKLAYGTQYKLAMIHFLNYGIKEPRSTSSEFNVNTYLRLNQDIKSAYGTNYKKCYIHYLKYGIKEGRKAI